MPMIGSLYGMAVEIAEEIKAEIKAFLANAN